MAFSPTGCETAPGCDDGTERDDRRQVAIWQDQIALGIDGPQLLLTTSKMHRAGEPYGFQPIGKSIRCHFGAL
jgi:hypothetical protein